MSYTPAVPSRVTLEQTEVFSATFTQVGHRWRKRICCAFKVKRRKRELLWKNVLPNRKNAVNPEETPVFCRNYFHGKKLSGSSCAYRVRIEACFVGKGSYISASDAGVA